jgi:hypothetical protein
MALQFEHSDAVEYARGFSKKIVLCLYVQAKALGCKKKAGCAVTSNRWRGCSKQSMV